MGTVPSLRRSETQPENEAWPRPRRLPRRWDVPILVALASAPLLLYLVAPILGLIFRTTPASYACCWEAKHALSLSLFTATIALVISIYPRAAVLAQPGSHFSAVLGAWLMFSGSVIVHPRITRTLLTMAGLIVAVLSLI